MRDAMVHASQNNVENLAAIHALNRSIQSLNLYGRRTEQEQLETIYKQFNEQQLNGSLSQLVLIHGASGTGKSALVEHAFWRNPEQNGVYCITGGFDQLMHVQQPHAAFVDAIMSLVHLVQERDQMALFRRLTQQLSDTVEEIEILIKLIPAIADAMAPAEGATMEAELSTVDATTLLGSHNSKEMASRFKYAILQFFRVVASGMGQVVLVLEDIHRADESALDLLSSLLCDSANRSILFVATYRDDSNTELLDTFLKKLPSQGTTVTHIPLQNLDSAPATDMIKSLLQIDPWWMYENTLVDFVLKQTKCNPYFILLFLRTLVEEGLLRYIPSSIPPWQCDPEELRIEFGETIVDILSRKIALLPPVALKTLRFASFLGSKVNLEIVSHLVGESETEVESVLQLAAENGLLVHHEIRGWSFAHDSIQDATLNFVPEDERDEFHYQIGRRLWKCFDIEKLDDNIFVVVAQLLAGKQYIVVERERTAVAKLCLRACERSVFVSSFHSAYDYVLNGIDLLGSQGWRENYDFTLALYNAAVELAYCTGHPKNALHFAECVIKQARCFEDSLHGLTMKVRTLGSIGNVDECVDFGLKVLARLDEKFPSNPGVVRCYLELQRIRFRVKRKTSESLLRLPLMTNERKLSAVHLLNQLFMYCCQSRPFLAPLLGFRVVALTLDFGISTTSCLGFVALGAILSGPGNDIDEGYRVGQIGMAMYETLQVKVWLAPLSLLYYMGIHTFKHPVTSIVNPMRLAQRVGAETGNIEESLICGLLNHFSQLEMKSLVETELLYEDIRTQISFYGFTNILTFSSPSLEAMHVWMGRSNREILERYKVDNCDKLVFIFAQFYAMMLSFVFGDIESAFMSSKHIRIVSSYPFGGLDASFIVFIDGLVAINYARKVKKRQHLRYGMKKIRQLRHWAKHSPELFLCRQYLLEAEMASVTRNSSAHSKYITSIAQAKYSGCIFVTALANELAGRYFLRDKNDKDTANTFIEEARRTYEVWGAIAKVEHLSNEWTFISEDCAAK